MNNNDKKLKQINKKSKTSKQNIKKSKNIFLKWLPMIVLSTALMIIIIDTTVLNVSIRNIVNDLNTNINISLIFRMISKFSVIPENQSSFVIL